MNNGGDYVEDYHTNENYIEGDNNSVDAANKYAVDYV
jgi:hypothetical protein